MKSKMQEPAEVRPLKSDRAVLEVPETPCPEVKDMTGMGQPRKTPAMEETSWAACRTAKAPGVW